MPHLQVSQSSIVLQALQSEAIQSMLHSADGHTEEAEGRLQHDAEIGLVWFWFVRNCARKREVFMVIVSVTHTNNAVRKRWLVQVVASNVAPNIWLAPHTSNATIKPVHRTHQQSLCQCSTTGRIQRWRA